jgi:hypothetical protein
MSVGNTSLPSFFSGITSPQSWINTILDLLSFSIIHLPADYVTAVPDIIIPGKLYLVGTGSTFATPGTIAVYLTTLSTSIVGIIPDVGTVVDGWVKTNTDWVKTQFVQGAQVVLSPAVASTVTLPITFSGVCTVINNGSGTVQIDQASGRTAKGLIGTPLPSGVYTVYQDAMISNMS